MALQSSGSISIVDIATEFGDTAPHSLSEFYGAATGIPTSGAINVKGFYGKSSQFTFTITSNQTNANLYTLAVNAGWDESSAVEATIDSGVIISASSTSSSALTIPSFPASVSLINNGVIVGDGGDGGNGAYGSTGTAGGSGGNALTVTGAVSITNNGTIAGGGGGGGAGYATTKTVVSYYTSYGGDAPTVWRVYHTYRSRGGGGGGGQSGLTASVGGTSSATAGTSGYYSSAGTGGSGSSATSAYGGPGGNGGSWGANGSSGGASGGTGGYAVSGNSNITWVTTGTRLGGIS